MQNNYEAGYSGVESLTVRSGDGEDFVSVRDVAVAATIQTAGGADQVTVRRAAANLPTTVQLGGGNDLLGRARRRRDGLPKL